MFFTAKDLKYLDLVDFRDHVIVVSRNLLQSFIIWKCLKMYKDFGQFPQNNSKHYSLHVSY